MFEVEDYAINVYTLPCHEHKPSSMSKCMLPFARYTVVRYTENSSFTKLLTFYLILSNQVRISGQRRCCCEFCKRSPKRQMHSSSIIFQKRQTSLQPFCKIENLKTNQSRWINSTTSARKNVYFFNLEGTVHLSKVTEAMCAS